MKEAIETLFQAQLKEWELAKQNYAALQKVELKEVMVGNAKLVLQFNPGRLVSSSAKVDKQTLAKRACFLCKENLPVVQKGILLSDDFTLLVNPFPILHKHFTIVNTKHTPQQITPYLVDFLQITQSVGKEYTLFYNGPKCGASAPDHMHFQAGLTAQFPVWKLLEQKDLEKISLRKVEVKVLEDYVCGFLVEGTVENEVVAVLKAIIAEFAELQPQESEPMLNILANYDNKFQVLLFPREKHRPSQYFAEKQERILLSPASVDFGGLLAVPRREDFERIEASVLEDIFAQLCLDSHTFGQLKEKIKHL